MSDLATFWDKVAVKYAADPIGDMAAYEYTLERTKSHLTPNTRALEIGCGTGSTALLLARHVATFTATDISPGMLAIAGDKLAQQPEITNLTFQTASAHDSFAGDPYDVIMANSLLHLVPNLDQLLALVAQNIVPGGYFISKTTCLGEPGGGAKGMAIKLAIPVMKALGKAPTVVRMLDTAQLQQRITNAGFEIVEAGNFPAGPPPAHYIIARRR